MEKNLQTRVAGKKKKKHLLPYCLKCDGKIVGYRLFCLFLLLVSLMDKEEIQVFQIWFMLNKRFHKNYGSRKTLQYQRNTLG